MADTLTITKSEHGPVKVLHLAGQLNAETQAELMDAARREQALGTRYLLIDLAHVDYIGGAGLAALHNIYKMFTPGEAVEAWEKDNHGVPYKSDYMKLAEASPSVYFILNIAGFLQNIPIYRTLDECLRSFHA